MRTIHLNILYSYPIKWSKREIFRDIIQNFYDDAGTDSFGGKLSVEFISEGSSRGTGKAVLSMESTGFSYEWLVHIGASTKQDVAGKYAGFFGEGFKMAALCALRDYDWGIRIGSRDWDLRVCPREFEIDGKTMLQLAYEINEIVDGGERRKTYVEIDNISAEDYTLLADSVNGFYYPGNPLIGKLVFKNEYIALHERTNFAKPDSFPISHDCEGDGIVYIGYQVRGSIFCPMVIANHRFKTSDRDRHNIYLGTLLDVLIDICDMVDGKTSAYLLEKFEKHWRAYPKDKNDVNTWHTVVRKLIRNLYWEPKDAAVFMKKHPALAPYSRPENISAHNEYDQAISWRRLYAPHLRLVQDSFRHLGYKSIVDLCREAGGFNDTRKPSHFESLLFGILSKAATAILEGFVSDAPDCVIIGNASSVMSGTAKVTKLKDVWQNSSGMRVRFSVKSIEIKQHLFARDRFAEAFATYCHELCHCFGGDSSAAFSRALTRLVEIVIDKSDCIKRYGDEWRRCFVKGKSVQTEIEP
jgi:hypothetical protein